MISPIITGAAIDVRAADIGELSHSIGLVLLATDGSRPAMRATQYAVLLTKLLGARLQVVYVDTGLEDLTVPEAGSLETAPPDLEPGVRALLVALELARANDVACAVEIVRGGVATKIVATAEKHQAGLVVLGDTGRTGLARIALGSVAEAVVKASTIPVVVVKAD